MEQQLAVKEITDAANELQESFQSPFTAGKKKGPSSPVVSINSCFTRVAATLVDGGYGVCVLPACLLACFDFGLFPAVLV
jgi:hypothetical protein